MPCSTAKSWALAPVQVRDVKASAARNVRRVERRLTKRVTGRIGSIAVFGVVCNMGHFNDRAGTVRLSLFTPDRYAQIKSPSRSWAKYYS